MSNNNLAKKLSDHWFIKTRKNKIRGPFSMKEVIEGLLARVIRPIDKVSKDHDIWIPLCDNPAFLKRVNEYIDDIENNRNKDLRHSEEVFNPDITISRGGDFSNLDSIAQGLEEQLEESKNLKRVSFELQALRNLSRDLEVAARRNQLGEGEEDPTKDYNNLFDEEEEKKPSVIWKFVKFMSIPCFFISFGYGVYYLVTEKPWEKINFSKEENQVETEYEDLDYHELLEKGLDQKRLGDYENALESLKAANTKGEVDIATTLELAELMIDNDSLQEAAELAQTVLDKNNAQPEELAKAHSLLGQVAINSKDSKQAENHFKKALNADPKFYPATYNLALTQISNKSYKEAERLLLLAIKQGGTKAPFLIALAETAASVDESQNKFRNTIKVDQLIEDYMAGHLNYYHELVLARMYLAAYRDDKSLITKLIPKFIDVDPNLTFDHIQDLKLNMNRYKWSNLKNWCTKIKATATNASGVDSILALCFLKSGKSNEALKHASIAFQKDPSNPYVASVMGYIQYQMGQGEQSNTKFQMASKDSKITFPYMTWARFCEARMDYKCAAQYWNEVIRRDPKNITGLTGLGSAYIQLSEYEKARKYISRGMALSPQYRPVMEQVNLLLKKGLTL